MFSRKRRARTQIKKLLARYDAGEINGFALANAVLNLVSEDDFHFESTNSSSGKKIVESTHLRSVLLTFDTDDQWWIGFGKLCLDLGNTGAARYAWERARAENNFTHDLGLARNYISLTQALSMDSELKSEPTNHLLETWEPKKERLAIAFGRKGELPPLSDQNRPATQGALVTELIRRSGKEESEYIPWGGHAHLAVGMDDWYYALAALESMCIANDSINSMMMAKPNDIRDLMNVIPARERWRVQPLSYLFVNCHKGFLENIDGGKSNS